MTQIPFSLGIKIHFLLGEGTIGSLDYTPEERQVLAKKSKTWECPICGKVADKLLTSDHVLSPKLTLEESSMLNSIALKVLIQ